jgi:pyrroloquinoline quinone biosynthesis protein D
MTIPEDGDVLVLPRGVRLRRCERRGAWFLLAPERAVRLDAVAAAILQGLDGARDVGGLVAGLAAEFRAPEERVGRDVRAFLADLIDRRMVEARR